MVKFLIGYSSGVAWFDVATDICVGVIVAAVVAVITWGIRDHIHFGRD